MATHLDHTIVPVRDREEAVEFYTRIFGFENLGEAGPFLAVRVDDNFNLDFRQEDEIHSHHYAFAMTPGEFESSFNRIKESGIDYGGGPRSHENKEGPGITLGSQGMGKAVYFNDPSGHLLEIKTY